MTPKSSKGNLPIQPPHAPDQGVQIVADTNLGSRRIVFARVGLAAVAVLVLIVFVASIPAYYDQLSTVCVAGACGPDQLSAHEARALRGQGLSVGFYASYSVALTVGFAAVWFAVGAVVAWRKPDERAALLVALMLMTFGPVTLTQTYSALATEGFAWWLAAQCVGYLGDVSFVLFFYLFPDGRFVPRWTRWLAVAWAAMQMPAYFFPSSPFNLETWSSWLAFGPFLIFVGTMLSAQVYRYRRVSGPVQRQQTKWVVFGIGAALLFVLSLSLPAFIFPGLTQPGSLSGLAFNSAFYFFMLFIPLAIGVAILRYRLFDIDLVINRTLVYGALTAIVVGLYVLVVGGLGALLQARGNLLLSLLGAGLVAVLFAPLREKLQRGVNRLMYGERDDPYAVLSRFGEHLEATLEPRAVLPEIVETIAQALKLPYAAIVLKESRGEADRFTVAASVGEPANSPVRLPLVYQHETVGELLLAPRAGEENFSAADRRLLDNLARQAGFAAHAVRLTNDLQRARERLVSAREEERRRLRRDLHDGLGPQLSSQTLTIDAALTLMQRDPAAAEALLLDLKGQARDAISDIRRLVYNLRPPALDDLGLLGALRETAAQYGQNGVRLSIEVPEDLPSLPAAVEVAAYRIVQEAMTNVARHAQARTCTVSLEVDDDAGTLRLAVRDDGRGLADPQAGVHRQAGVGLISMRERAAELGGSLIVESLPEGGTSVRAWLPLPEEE